METFEPESRIFFKNQLSNIQIKIEPSSYDFPPTTSGDLSQIQEESCSSDGDDGQFSLAFSQWPTESSSDNNDSFRTVDVLWPLSKSLVDDKCGVCPKQNCDSRRHSTKSQWIYPTCENCGIELNDLVELIINRSVRSVDSCEVCLIKYQPNDPDSVGHVLKHFDRENVSSIEQLCADCSSASNVDETNDYLFVEKLEEVQLVDCKWCANTVCASTIKQHQRRCYKKPERIKNPDPRPQIFECSQCPKKYSSYKNLSNHIMSVHDPPSHQVGFQCRFCDELFTRSQRLVHEKEVHMHPVTGLYQCEYCDRQCKSASEMEYHRYKHTTPFSCDICGHRCGMKRRLEEHMLTHSNIRDHQCTLCGEAFKTPHLLKRHKERRHSNVRPFQCKQCDKAYKDATDLRRHSRSHGGVEKNFKCQLCKKAFFEAKLLRYHMRTHDRHARVNKINAVLMVKDLEADEDEDNVLIMDH